MDHLFKNDEIVFALYGGKSVEKDFKPQCLIGTLFPIGGDIFYVMF